MKPTIKVDGVRTFRGKTGYYRQCIAGYSQIAEPSVQLTRRNVKFLWGSKEQEAFDTLKKALVSSDVMVYPQPGKQYHLYCDASDIVLGPYLLKNVKKLDPSSSSPRP
jgi:Zn/Cd-binding protein ZinT